MVVYNGETDEEDDSSSEEHGSEDDEEHAVDYSSCQLPVVLLVFILIRLVAVLGLFSNFRPHQVTYLHHRCNVT